MRPRLLARTVLAAHAAVRDGAGGAALARGLGLESVAEALVGVDEATVWQRRLELAPELAHVNIDRAIARSQLAPPDGSEELRPGDDRAHPLGHRDEHLELPHRQRQRPARRQHEAFAEADLELTGVERVGPLGRGGHGPTPSQPARAHTLPSRDRVVKKP